MNTSNISLQALLAQLLHNVKEYTEKRQAPIYVDRLATQILASNDIASLPSEVLEAIHCIFDVHDGREASWHPSDSELLDACAIIKGFLGGMSNDSTR